MHPGMIGWWKWKHAERHAHHEGRAHHEGHAHHGHGGHGHGGCGPSGEGVAEVFAGGEGFDFDGGSFGVRRPLRFLAHKLELDEKQVAELAHVLNELKTERAQAAVDHRRTVAGFADVIASEAFDESKAGAVAAERVKSAERLRDALVKALGRIHALLHTDQRARFAYLIRTGALSL
jgi:Spy/CpxP family protein refolding chaperone